jgi:hypothetical protein
MGKYNAGGAVGGGINGAAAGAAIGSAVPGIGTALGAIGGGIAGFVGSLFGNKKKKQKIKKLPTMDDQQMALYNDYIQGIRGQGQFADQFKFDSQGYNKVFDETVGRYANRNFNEKIIPGITGQFRQNNLGTSSYLGESLANAGRDVQENLDAQRSANVFAGQQQANMNRQNAINQILNTQTFTYSQPAPQQQSGVDGILNGLAPIAGDWLADYLRGARAKVGGMPSAAPGAIPTPTV